MSRIHTNSDYEAELKELREKLIAMALVVKQMVAASVNSYLHADSQLARETVERDDIVDNYEVNIDNLCVVILARRQPLGKDLRLITLVLKMVKDFERVGDLAVNICERTLRISKALEPEVKQKIQTMEQHVNDMMKNAIESFAEANETIAQAVIGDDNLVDEAYASLVRDLISKMVHDPRSIESLIDSQSVAKLLERIADHCTNIAELVVFMIRGTDIRHTAYTYGNLV